MILGHCHRVLFGLVGYILDRRVMIVLLPLVFSFLYDSIFLAL